MHPLSHSLPSSMRLGQLLLRRNTITQAQLELALKHQQQSGLMLGEALISLGLIDQKTLKRTLRRQSWFKPCTLLAITCSSFSTAWADDKQHDFSNDWTEFNRWVHVEQESLNRQSDTLDVVVLLTKFGWNMYYGEQKAGEMNFVLKKPDEEGFAVQMSVRF